MVEARAKLVEERVIIDNERNANMLNIRGYGRLIDEKKLELHPVEALYLIEKKKLKLSDGNYLGIEEVFDRFSSMDDRFEQKFLVYKDLRRRGYKIRCFHDLNKVGIDYSLKPKRVDQRDIFVVCRNERKNFVMSDIISQIEKVDPLIEEIWVGVVDEEGEVTYYRIEEIDPKGKLQDIEDIHADGILLKNLVIIKGKNGKRLFDEGFYGNLSNGDLTISIMEAIHLVDNGILNVHVLGRQLDRNELMSIAKFHQPDIDVRYSVYRDLKERNMCVKTGYKFGAHFRVYGRDPKKYHADYLVDAVTPGYTTSWPTISRAVRLAHSVRKTYVLAVVSDKSRYFSLERIRP